MALLSPHGFSFNSIQEFKAVMASLQLDRIPDLVQLHQAAPETYPYLLESSAGGNENSRYSILMAYPEQTTIQFPGEPSALDEIELDLTQSTDIGHPDLPFVGGWFVYLAYEYTAYVEPTVDFYADQDQPLTVVARIPAAVIIDHQQESACIVSESRRSELLSKINTDISQLKVQQSTLPGLELLNEEGDQRYLDMVLHAKQYIRDGDIFQANLSRLWQGRFEHAPLPASLHRRLCQTNPAPFSALAKIGKEFIVSSSPERLVKVEQGIMETRPIAGTHPRARNAQHDRALSENLLAHPKERAEHVMLIDLERNDLGRVCEPGSVQVTEQMVLESYRHVHHIVSSIEGRVKPGSRVKDIIHAVFPGGTITGCPKVRCMQIISELEQSARGSYTGSLGYISLNGRMDLNILIRTMTLSGHHVSFRAGAGIVHDSDPQRELEETRHKARGMVHALYTD